MYMYLSYISNDLSFRPTPYEQIYDRNLTETRGEIVTRIRDLFIKNQSLLLDDNIDILSYVEKDLEQYESNFTECMRHVNNNNIRKQTWTFWNAMFYSGTIFTTIAKIDSFIRFAMIMENVIGLVNERCNFCVTIGGDE
ncbi:unnamed protein product [Arctia plantaginis]|uniref:Uncharacterized protein n=1 Tax=Arctia plantaginis TaxID=874455 RepID=A0A8S1BN21_ARCPL|nr:unnamed protein product [Arctia plantaginis]